MVQREIPGDSKQPAAQVIVRCHRDRGPADSEEDLLRQIPRDLSAASRPAEVPEKAAMVRGVESCEIGHAPLLLKNARRPRSSRKLMGSLGSRSRAEARSWGRQPSPETR